MRGGGSGQGSRVCLPLLGEHEVPASKCSVFAREFRCFAGIGADPVSGAGRLMAGSDESPELANSSFALARE